MMRAQRTHSLTERGMSLVEICVAVALLAIVCAIAVPSIIMANRTSGYRQTIASIVNDVVKHRADASHGATTEYVISRDALVFDGSIVLNPEWVEPPERLPTPDTLTFQGGTGYLYVGPAAQPAAIIIADIDSRPRGPRPGTGEVYAIVVGRTSGARAYRLTSNGWEDYTV